MITDGDTKIELLFKTPLEPPSLSNGAIKEEELNSSTEFFIKCPQCQKGCQSFQALKEHTEIAHADLTTSSENTLSVSSALSPTSLGPSPLGRYGCSQCSSSFSSKEQLEKHELLHSPNAQVSCKICHKTFANVYRLQRHMISHDESAVLRKFKCTECDKAFKFKHHLKEHIRIHSGEKPFECGNCGKRFSHSGSYSSHMTSKKCLVMNLKLGRTRGALNTTLLDKNLTQNLKGTKRPAPSPIINNNISSSPNHNSPYMPIMPKYADASAAAALFQSQLAGNSAMTPFYLTPHSLLNAAHPISPYSASALGHLLEQLQQQAHQHHQQQQQQQQQLSCSSPVSRSSLMDTTESNHHHVPKIIKSENDKMSMTISEIHHHQTPEDFDDLSKSNASECGELVMDEDSDVHSNEITVDDKSNDKATIEVLKRFSETVIKESPTMNTIAESANSTTTTTTTTSQHSPVAAAEHLNCDHCNGYFKTMASFDEHDCIKDCQSEGLAAKLEAALTPKSENGSIENTSSAGEDHDFDRTSCQNLEEMDSENYATTDHVNEDGKKVRVRSLISEDQLRVLKDKYTENPRPKREELEKIALSIGFPVRVVQVWFQNTRARDRREGRLIPVPFTPTAVPPTSRYSITLTPLKQQQQQQIVTQSPHHLHHEYISEQPLDLSVKKGTFSNDTSPSSSPKRPLSVTHSESHDEVVNLSHKTYKEETVSPTSYLSYQNHFQGSNSSDGRQTPTTLAEYNSSRLAQILAQPAHKLTGIPGMGIVPMDHLLQFGAHDLPSITQLITNRMKSLSPISVHHSPHHDLSNNHQDEESLQSKRAKVHQMLLKSIGTAAGIQEPEAEGQFQCDQCDKAFSKQSSLARHKYEHSGQRPHKCDECTKAFKHKHHLTEHKRLHSGEKPFQCKKCLKRFSHSGSYSQHMNHRYSYCKPYRE